MVPEARTPIATLYLYVGWCSCQWMRVLQNLHVLIMNISYLLILAIFYYAILECVHLQDNEIVCLLV